MSQAVCSTVSKNPRVRRLNLFRCSQFACLRSHNTRAQELALPPELIARLMVAERRLSQGWSRFSRPCGPPEKSSDRFVRNRPLMAADIAVIPAMCTPIVCVAISGRPRSVPMSPIPLLPRGTVGSSRPSLVKISSVCNLSGELRSSNPGIVSTRSRHLISCLEGLSTRASDGTVSRLPRLDDSETQRKDSYSRSGLSNQ